MALDSKFAEYISDQLEVLPSVEMKKMFGGIGYFKEGIMFGMIGGSTFRLRVDETTKARYESAGMQPYQNDKKKKGMPYWEVPEQVYNDKDQLKEWAEEAYQVAVNNKK